MFIIHYSRKVFLLKAYIDSVLDVVGAAQEPDGYLYTARTINPQHPHGWSGNKRWVKDEELSHELYNLGHMVDAACAHYQATGSTKFLNIAKRYADCVVKWDLILDRLPWCQSDECLVLSELECIG